MNISSFPRIFGPLAALLFVLFLTACNKKNELIEVNEAYAAYVESYTSGTVSKTASIRVRFTPGTAKNHVLNEVLKEDLFSFKPSLKGQTSWVDERTIEFRPDKTMDPGAFYEVHLNLKTIAQVPEEFNDFAFNVKVMDPSFTMRQFGLTVEGNSTSKMQYAGEIVTADKEDSAAVEKILSANTSSDDLKISWTHDVTGRNHGFKINGIQRSKKEDLLELNWNGASINSKEKGSSTHEIPAIGDFKVMNVISVNNDDHFAKIQFSAPINNNADLTGLITTEPAISFNFRIQGSEVFCYPIGGAMGDYTLVVHPGIENIWKEKLSKKSKFSIYFEDNKPFVQILGKGEIIPSSGKVILPFEACNLSAVDLTIVKIYSNNIPQFYQVNDYGGDYQLRRVAKPLLQKTLRLDKEKGLNLRKTNRFSFEMDQLIQADPGAVYRVTLSFRPEYSLYSCSSMETDEDEDYYYEETDEEEDTEDQFWNYYDDNFPFGYSWDNRENPCHKSYYNYEKWDHRNVIASNIGILAKRGNDKSLFILTTDLISADPMSGVGIEILDYQQQPLFKGTTGADGILQMQVPGKPFLLIAKKGKERNYLKLDDGNSLMLSRFDVSGDKVKNGLKGFIYGERGVWRPGDSLYINFILEDKFQKIPKDLPVEFSLYNPQGQLFKKMVSKTSVEGIYAFHLATLSSSPTGNWTAKVKAGGAVFEKRIKIETIMPNRLKIDLNLNGAKVLTKNSKQPIQLSSMWLFGAPAQSLKSSVDVTFSKKSAPFEAYKTYSFDDPFNEFYPESKNVFDGKLNENGTVQFTPTLNIESEATGMLNAGFLVKVFEPGGAFSVDYANFDYSPFETYVGVKAPEGVKPWGFLATGKAQNFSFVQLSPQGNLISGTTEAEVSIYKLEWRWWWDNSGDDYTNYTSGNYNKLIKTEKILLQNGKGNWKINLDSDHWGRYLVLIKDLKSGHTAGKEVYFDDPYWQTRDRGDVSGSETMLSFTTDKTSYKTNDNIQLSIPSSAGAKILITLENGSKVIQSYWVNATAGQTRFSFKATPEMAPNIYIHASLIQPHAQTKNDRPIRMYGIVPVEIKDPQTVLKPVITVAEVVRPEKPFTIQVKESTGKPMAYTLAIVDEGLLDITRFKTPDPHKTFYAKEALGVKTWDVFDRVMGSFAGNYGRLLTIGGDEGLLGKKSGNKANRFPPVVRHLGTFYLKANENKTHKVTLPPYFGSVKVMVVAAKNGSYGNADKAVAVRNPLMVSATAPRVLSPQEEISIPVNVFATENNIRNVTIDLSTNSNLKIIGAASQNISFSGTGEKTVYFRAKVGGNEDLATIKVRASSGNQVSQSELQVEVRNPNPPITLVASQTVLAGKSVSMDVIPVGTPSKSTAMLEISAVPPLQLKKRLGYLIQYPHGCIEQTTSSVFPQLYLSALTDLDAAQLQKLENNIKAAITRLKSFQTSDGGFSYWPGMSTADDWGSNYAGHFLLEAKSRGYLVPDDLLTPWLNYTKSKAEKWSIGANSPSFYVDEITQAYRLYLLSLAGRPSLGAMNRLKEFKNLGDETKWRLAFAYQKSGYPRQASSLISGLSAKLPYKDDFGYTYGSPLRQQAMILEATAALGRTQDARILMTNIAEQLSSENWFSTQSTAYALMAIAKQSGLMSKDNALNAVCTVNGKEVKVSSRKLVYQIPVNVSKGKTQVNIKHNGTEGTLFVRIITEGKPLPEETLAQSAASSGLDMRISFMDMGGNMVDPKKLQQGKDFVAKVSINQKNNNITYKNLALSAVFPSGWEIINTRLWDAASSFSSSPYTYQDVRDDRIYTYFDLSPKNTLTYYFMLNAAYTGKYFFPITRVEAMYDNNVYAQSNGQWVEIIP